MHKPHVTVAAIVKKQDRFLLVKECDKFTKEICYNQPAGHLEENETLSEAASRELLEETGFSLKPIGFLGVYNLHAANGVHYLRFCFIFDGALLDSKPAPIDNDILDSDWYTVDEIKNLPLRSPLVAKCIDDSLTRAMLGLEIIFD